MQDIENATMLLNLARADLATMLALKDAKDVPDQIFGFHCQQAVEKTLKAWLSVLGITYPFTHSLDTLLGLVEDEIGTAEVAKCRHLDALGPYAVQLRYSAQDDSILELDRMGLIVEIDRLLLHVDAVVRQE